MVWRGIVVWGEVRCGVSMHGKAGMAGLGTAWCCGVLRGMAGETRLG